MLSEGDDLSSLSSFMVVEVVVGGGGRMGLNNM